MTIDSTNKEEKLWNAGILVAATSDDELIVVAVGAAQ